MNPSKTSPRKKRDTCLNAEALESRSLLTAGAGNTFAIIPGTVAKVGDVTAIKFTIDPAHFHVPKGKFTLGIDVAPDPTGTLKPTIAAVRSANGKLIPQTFHSVYDPHLATSQAGTSGMTSAVLTPVHLNAANPKAPVTYEVDVKGLSGTSGKFLLGFYLPGDANGDGKVDQTDVNVVTASLNARASSTTGGTSKYSFGADVNRDGRIGKIDLRYTQQNLGVSTDITPVVGAKLDAKGMVDVNQRLTRTPNAHFTGTMTPGGTITYAVAAGKSKPVTTTADSTGNYSINVPLTEGANTFKVTTLDAFGQSISGTLAAVNYSTNPPITAAAAAASAKATTPGVVKKT